MSRSIPSAPGTPDGSSSPTDPGARTPPTTGAVPSGVRAALQHVAGQVFGAYRLVGEVGVGGMAELFLALQGGLEGFTKVVAVKRILPQMASSQEFVAMFLDEARLAARLDHANIVRIYDLGSIDGKYYISMEYLPGEDLARLIAAAERSQKPISPDLAAAVVQSASDGLHFAHQLTDEQGHLLNVVHRDVNPSNIIVTYQGQVKLVDFGIAKASVNAGGTQSGMIKGKPGYIAPEQAVGQPADARSDVFCLGIVLWELLSGRRLFIRETDAGTLMAILNDSAPSLLEIRPDVDLELDQIVQTALAKDATHRYQSAGELHDALDRWFQGKTARPSPRHIAAWLTDLFGEERARAKLSLARGTNLESNIALVMKPVTPSATTPAVIPLGTPATPVISAPPKRGGLALGAFAAFLALGVAGAVIATRSTAPAAAPVQASVSLSVDSDPQGAFLFLGGEPTGRTTPAQLNDLTPSSTVMIRLEKEGFAPIREEVALGADGMVSRRFTLQKLSGRVRFANVPSGVTVMVDGVPAVGEVVELGVGAHSVQVMSAGRVVWSRGVTVSPGETTVEIPAP